MLFLLQLATVLSVDRNPGIQFLRIPSGEFGVETMGGNVRVGLEDSLYIGPGKLAKSNAEQVAKIRRIVEELGYEIATPGEARTLLGLKGADRVKF